jgi:alpha/beta superfamily hydrolase
MEIAEEHIVVSGDGRTLSGILAYPQERSPRRAVLFCSPHPHFAGNMDNNVIRYLAQSLAADSVTLRFDYRGVGQSTISLPPELSVFDYWEQVETTQDFSDAVADIDSMAKELTRIARGLDLILIGYSFGAVTGPLYGIESSAVVRMIGIAPPVQRVTMQFLQRLTKPCLLVAGCDDFVYSEERFHEAASSATAFIQPMVLDGCDHFFRGDESRLLESMRPFLECESVIGKDPG